VDGQTRFSFKHTLVAKKTRYLHALLSCKLSSLLHCHLVAAEHDRDHTRQVGNYPKQKRDNWAKFMTRTQQCILHARLHFELRKGTQFLAGLKLFIWGRDLTQTPLDGLILHFM
jgi:hypothetical protein